MGEEIFQKFEYIKQTGDDGLPRDIIQIDCEDKDQKHIHRAFVDAAALREFLSK